MTLDSLLLLGATAAVLLWAALSAYVLRVSAQRERVRSAAAAVLAILQDDDVRAFDLTRRLERVRPLLDGLSRDMILYTAADPTTPKDAFEVLASYLVGRWTMAVIVQEAASHRQPRDVWRRTAALRILFHLRHPSVFDLLERALEDPNPAVGEAALSLLGTSKEPVAVEIMVRALKTGRQRAALIASRLESSPQRPMFALLPLLKEEDPVVRSWAARLLGEYPGTHGLEIELLPLTADADPRVRKAAIESLGKVGDDAAADAAVKLLGDPVPFVRAHAARALGDLERADRAGAVAVLLGDFDWWVRAAAKQSLEAMGSEVWTALVPCLDNADRFVRNGAAEVFQNLGILDSLVVMEAASDSPSPSKIDLLRRIAHAGGSRLTDSLVERAGPLTGPKIRRLLATMGLQHVEAV